MCKCMNSSRKLRKTIELHHALTAAIVDIVTEYCNTDSLIGRVNKVPISLIVPQHLLNVPIPFRIPISHRGGVR